MAGNLTPEQMAQLYRLFSTPVESSDPNANSYMPENVYMDGRTYDRRDAGYMGYDYNPTDWTDPRTQESQSLFNGQSFDEYGKDGTFSNSGVFTGIEDRNKYGDMIGALSILAMPFAAAGLGAGAAGAGAAGAGGAGAGAYGAASSAGMLAPAGLGAAAGGTGLWGAGAAGLGGAAGAAGAAGAYGAGSSAGMQGLAGSTAAFDGAMAGGSGLAGVGGASTGGSLLSSLGGSSNLLGLGSTLLGAAAGAKGQEQSSTTRQEMTPELKPFLFGSGGLLSQVQQQLAVSRSPERMAQWDQMRNVSMNLLNQPIAGNPTTGWTFPR
jgi:hypothetical protein